MSIALEALLEKEKATAEAHMDAERAVQAAKQLKDSIDAAARRVVAVPVVVGSALHGKATAAILEAHDAAEALVHLATLRAEVAATDAEAAYLAVKAASHPDDV